MGAEYYDQLSGDRKLGSIKKRGNGRGMLGWAAERTPLKPNRRE